VLGWPVASNDVLRGLLVIALAGEDVPDAAVLAVPRVACDQLALALERHALAEQVRRQQALMSQLEERAQSGEASFSELIAVVAHEIRTPLTSIKAYTESLIDAPASEFEARRSFLTVIDEECDRLARRCPTRSTSRGSRPAIARSSCARSRRRRSSPTC
jgi:signal transduction histidine kinase